MNMKWTKRFSISVPRSSSAATAAPIAVTASEWVEVVPSKLASTPGQVASIR